MKNTKTIYLIIIFTLLILLTCLGIYTYNLKTSSEANNINNNTNIANNNSIATNDTSTNIGENIAANDSTTDTTIQTNYNELTSTTLGKDDVFFVTNVIENNDNTYTLTGVIYTHDDINYNEAQISDRWILSDEYRSITISKNLPCSMKFDYDNMYNTVEDVFFNYQDVTPENTSNPYYKHSFTFVFEGDKCVSVENVLTGLEP